MTRKIGFIIDPPDRLKTAKDSSIAMMEAAARRGWQVHVMLQSEIRVEARDGQVRACASTRLIEPRRSQHGLETWYRVESEQRLELSSLDVLMMRKDPPFDMEYINTTYLLDIAEQQGVLVVNRPGALRDCNEKTYITRFPQCCTPMCLGQNRNELRAFIEHHGDCIVKPLDGMGGAEIYRVTPGDANLSVILESITRHGTRTVMAQTFIPEISDGDKRILLIDGEAVPYALARIPARGETRGNLAAGGSGVGVELNERDRWICAQLADDLRARGILFAGIDVIGDYLTEINITSPTCIRELDAIYGLDIGGELMAAVAARLD